MQEKFATFSKTFTVPQTSKYHSRLDRTLLRIVQAGLAEKYKKDELEKAARRSRNSKLADSPTVAPFGLEVLLPPIALCMVMHVFNFLVFIIGKV